MKIENWKELKTAIAFFLLGEDSILSIWTLSLSSITNLEFKNNFWGQT